MFNFQFSNSQSKSLKGLEVKIADAEDVLFFILDFIIYTIWNDNSLS